MGIFGKSSTLKEVEETVREKLLSNPLLDEIMQDIENHIMGEYDTENGSFVWLKSRMAFFDNGKNDYATAYYDTGKRTVLIEEDNLTIMWYTTYYVRGADGKEHKQNDVHEKLQYRYTNNGYRPLHSVNMKGEFLSEKQVCEMWTGIIREKLVELLPDCKFDLQDGQMFEYKTPEIVWRDWL